MNAQRLRCADDAAVHQAGLINQQNEAAYMKGTSDQVRTVPISKRDPAADAVNSLLCQTVLRATSDEGVRYWCQAKDIGVIGSG